MIMNVFSRVLLALLPVIWLLVPAHAKDDDKEGGIIGTGIVGEITQLGSIYVNNQRIFFDDTMRVAGSVYPLQAGGLQPGHTVAVIVERDKGRWVAQHIRQVLPLVGQVAAADKDSLTVLSTRVVVGDLTVPVEVGDWVAVSGLWKGQTVMASRIEPLKGSDQHARISGTYLPNDTGELFIGGSHVSGIRPQHLQPGDLLQVFGRPTASGIEATRIETGVFDQSVRLIQVQGYYSVPQPDGLYTVLGSGLVAYSERPEMIDDNAKVIRCGSMGRLRAAADDIGFGSVDAAELKC